MLFTTLSTIAVAGLFYAGSEIYNTLKGDAPSTTNYTSSNSTSSWTTSSQASTTSTTESVVHEDPVDYYNTTLDYCYYLTKDELEDYINSNYDLQRYASHIDLDRDKYYVCSDIALLAEKLGRSFDDRFNRY